MTINKWLMHTFFLLGATVLSGCGSDGIDGLVVDNDGNPIGGVDVAIEKSRFKVITDESGRYLISYVPGKMVLSFEKAGYQSAKLPLHLNEVMNYPAETVELKSLNSSSEALSETIRTALANQDSVKKLEFALLTHDEIKIFYHDEIKIFAKKSDIKEEEIVKEITKKQSEFIETISRIREFSLSGAVFNHTSDAKSQASLTIKYKDGGQVYDGKELVTSYSYVDFDMVEIAGYWKLIDIGYPGSSNKYLSTYKWTPLMSSE